MNKIEEKKIEKIINDYLKISEDIERLNFHKNQLKAEIMKLLDKLPNNSLETSHFLVLQKTIVRKQYVVPEIIYKDFRIKKK